MNITKACDSRLSRDRDCKVFVRRVPERNHPRYQDFLERQAAEAVSNEEYSEASAVYLELFRLHQKRGNSSRCEVIGTWSP
jgi:hypothetical protein